MKRSNRPHNLTVVLKFIFWLILISVFSIATLGQTARTVFYVVELRQQDIGRVVKRVLSYYFKPSNAPKVIYLAKEGIQKSWLPSIKNVEFQLLFTDEIEQKKINVYLFSDIWQETPGLYQVTFSYGDPNCKHLGDLWNFRLSNRRLSLWRKQDGQIEGKCSRDPAIVKY